MRCQPEGAVEPLGEHAFGFRRLSVCRKTEKPERLM
jgi:hypothetical protein